MTKQCAYFAKGKEYQEAQQAAALGPPKPVKLHKETTLLRNYPIPLHANKLRHPLATLASIILNLRQLQSLLSSLQHLRQPSNIIQLPQSFQQPTIHGHPPSHSTTKAKLASSLTTTINPTTAKRSKNRAHEPTQSNNNQQPNLNLWHDTCNHQRIQRGSRQQEATQGTHEAGASSHHRRTPQEFVVVSHPNNLRQHRSQTKGLPPH